MGIKIQLGTEVGSAQKRGHSLPLNFRPLSIVVKRSPIAAERLFLADVFNFHKILATIVFFQTVVNDKLDSMR